MLNCRIIYRILNCRKGKEVSLIVLNLECTSSGRSPRNLAEFQVVENIISVLHVQLHAGGA